MENERVLYAHESGLDQGFRLFVTGAVDQRLCDVLKAFVEFQEKVIASGVVSGGVVSDQAQLDGLEDRQQAENAPPSA